MKSTLRWTFLSLALVASFSIARAQSVITTVAGTDFTFPNTPIPGINAPTGTIFGIAVDSAGNVFVSDYGSFKVLKLDPKGSLTVVAGNSALVPYGGALFDAPSSDGGLATSASLCFPGGLAIDQAGNLYIADECNFRVRKVTPDGIITTVAGNGTFGYSGDGGPAVNAALSEPTGIAVDAEGDLFIADYNNNVIREVTPDGVISTYAGTGTAGYSGDGGQAGAATLNGPFSVTVDAGGNVFIADNSNSVIRKVNPAGVISTVAGNGTFTYSGDGGPAMNAALCGPNGLTVDAAGDLFIADSCNQVIREVNPAGIINTVAGENLGSGFAGGFSGDGNLATNAELNFPGAVAVDSSGNLFIGDSHNHRVRKVNTAGIIQTIVGNGQFQFSGDGGPAITATFDTPSGVTVDTAGDLFVADTRNNRIRKITPSGIITTVAGNGVPNASQGAYPGENGPALNAPLTSPMSVAVDRAGNLFIADTFANAIRKVTPDGNIHTVVRLDPSNGGVPFRILVDPAGNLLIADTYGNAIRKLTPSGYLTTIAGNGNAGYSGDGGPAIAAALNYPTGIALDTAGNLFISDSANNVIRKVTQAGIISTVVGTGKSGYSGDGGPAISATLFSPQGIAIDAAGDLFIADDNSVIRMVTPAGIISTFAGNGTLGFSGDGGLATQASLGVYPDPTGQPNNSGDVALDSAGNLYIADPNNNRIRKVLANRPVVTVAPNQLQFSASSNGAPATPQFISLASPVEGIAFSLTTDASWLQISPSSGTSPRVIQVSANPTGLAPNVYQAAINISTPTANPAYTLVTVTFNVTAAQLPKLSVDKTNLSFPFPQHGVGRSQSITVSNTGGGTLTFITATTTSSGGNWLSASPSNVAVLPGSPVSVAVTANPAGLAPGAYSGAVIVSFGSESQAVAVTMTISTLSQAILLSQSGLSFLAVQAGGVIPSQSFGVSNIGTGVVNWTASTSTLAGGPDWLQVTPGSGSSDAAAATSPRVTVSVNGSALAAGTYYGLVRVDAPGAANSPQVLTVFLQVLPANTSVPGVVQPAQLVFTAAAGGESPSSQTIQVFNIASGTRSFQSHLSADPGLLIATTPQNVTLDPQQPTTIVVQPVIAGYNEGTPITTSATSGVYNATLTLQFSDGTVSAVQIKVVVANNTPPAPSQRRTGPRPADAGAGCAPTMLLPTLTTLGQGFAVSAGWPTALVVNVTDDCGAPMPNTGSVTVNFSNGDPPLTLLAQGAGGWESTWQTGNANLAGVTLKVHADNSHGLTGDQVVNGNLASQQQPPVFDKSGIVSPATASSFTALAPGAAITIYGSRLAESALQAQTLPLPLQLVDTQVFVSGTTASGTSTGLLALPLYYVNQNQVNAVIPYEASVDTSLQLLVQRGNTYSVPVQIDMAQAQPAVFSLSGAPGGAGVIYVYPSSGQPYLASPTAPAHVGDTIVLYCTGLGAVNPGVADGAAAPGPPLASTVTSPQLTIGGQSATVSFAGLTPGFAGLYQVNSVVPSGVPTGSSVPVTLNIDGQTSPVTTIAIQ